MSERPDSSPELSRRGVFRNLVNGIAAAIAAALAIPLGAFFVLPAFKKSKADWKEVGPLEDFAVGEIKLVPLKPLEKREWPEDWGKEAAWVYRKNEREFVVYDLHCTHVGCPVNWSPQAKRFFSPCHGGAFDPDGRVLAGPPPRPLDRYETRIERGVLYAGAIYRLNRRLERVVS
jgi:menaquinol-cytochrome c reductase iron-sulfur subunit